MKNVSKLALFVAAGMLSAGANANTIVLGEEGTSLSLSGGFASEYLVRDTVDSSFEEGGDDPDNDNRNDLAGEIELGFEAVRNFENFDAYFEGTFEFATQETGGTGTNFDGAAAGIEGDFGTLEVGHTDNVYEDLITDALDITEQAGLTYGTDGFDEDNMLTYYSPETAGFSFNLQAGIEDEVEGTEDESEQGFIASAAYDFGAGAIHVGYDERGDTADSGDELIGIAAVFGLGQTEVSVAHEMQTISDADTDFTGIAVSYDYGMGNLYGAFQSVSPDAGDDQSQYAVGVSADIEDGMTIYAELADFDGQAATDADSLMAVGLDVSF